MLAILLKYSISYSPYSGQGKPPLYGDFEAQRHWMELTTNLPIKEWYFYDLQYWGLDYPPLTAYHSFLCGKLAAIVDYRITEFEASRGIEGDFVKLFMRLSALFSDILIFFPSIYYYCEYTGITDRSKTALLLLIMPAMQLIDHGHFQYNSVMLGFSLLSFALMINNRYLLGSISFVCALMFKQMALFYALPVFFFLLVTYH